jgi:Pectate lyase superfamily protein
MPTESIGSLLPGFVTSLDYGMDPRGQRDCTAQMQQAINDNTAGGVIVMAPGTYLFTSTPVWGAAGGLLIWTLPGVTLTGAGGLPGPAGSNGVLSGSPVGLAGVPTTIALGDIAAAGAGATGARFDHRHGMPSTLVVANGTAAAPGLSFTIDPSTGFYAAIANQLRVAAGGSLAGLWSQYSLNLTFGMSFGWFNSGLSANDLVLWRDAAATLAQRDGVNPQTFRLYNTYTDANNYERLTLGWTANELRIGGQNAGTGSARDLRLFAANDLILNSAGFGGGWRIPAAGQHFLASTDNAYDIGQVGAYRPRNLYLAGIATLGGSLAMAGPAGANSIVWTASPAKLVPGIGGNLSLRDGGDAFDNLLITNAGNVSIRGGLNLANLAAFVGGDHYVTVDAAGNLHKSAIGPAS